MDQSTQKVPMDRLDSRINIELVIEHERKLMDTLKIASVPAKGKDPIFATPYRSTDLGPRTDTC